MVKSKKWRKLLCFKILLVFISINIVLPFLFLARPLPVYASDITITPASGTVNTSVLVEGNGFSGRLATIYWDNQIILNKVPISEGGKLKSYFEVPTACKGNHTVKITDDSNWTSSTASATFKVVPGISIFPRIGRPYSSVMIIGNGFASFEKDIKVTLDKNVLPVSATASNLGVWSINIEAPGPDKGEYYISAFSNSTSSSDVGSVKFIAGPFAKMQPSSGSVGTEIAIVAYGFRTSEDGITITLDNQIILCNLIANPVGTMNTKLNIPAATYGHHLIGVYGSDFTPRGIIPDMDFNVIPNIKLEPASGNTGTKVSVNGTGFTNSEIVNLTFDGTSLNINAVADNKGSFSIIFIAPQSVNKENKVKAMGTSGNSAEAIFIMQQVTPTAPILLSPTKGAKIPAFDSVGSIFLGAAKQLTGFMYVQDSEHKQLGLSDVIFDWSDINIESKITYTLEIANNKNSSIPMVLKKGLVDSEYSLSKDDVLMIGSYKWKVMAVDDIGNQGLWSDTQEFEVIPMSNKVLIMSLFIPLVLIGAVVGLVILAWRRFKATR